MSDLLKLINGYLNSVEAGMRLFEEKLGGRDVMLAWRKGDLEQNGEIAPNVEYELHGIGCYLSFRDFDVDFDFGPGGRSDGFDLWRLAKYAKQFPEEYPVFQDKFFFEHAFNELIMDGIISQPFLPECNLFFLSAAE